jgi:hypothetical protein
MKIAILSRNINLYSTKRLIEAGKQRGHEMMVLDHQKCVLVIEKNRPHIFYKGQEITDVGAVIPRIGASVTFYGAAVVRQFEMMKIFTAVESQALVRSRDKLRSLQLLSRAGIGMPKTAFASEPKNKPGAKQQRPSDRSPLNRSPSNGSPSTKNAVLKNSSSQKPIQKSVDQKARPANPSTPSPASKSTWFQRAANQLAGWIPYTTQRRRVTAQRDEQSESIDLASQSTSKRTRLRQIGNDSELLASNESQEETQVLGSLVGLRYRDARKTYLRWLLFSGIIAALTLIGGPLVWQQIPVGWRELIWQKVTFSEASQDQSSETPFGDGTTRSPTEALDPEPMPLSLPETELQMVPSPLEDPISTEPAPTEPAPTEPAPTEPAPIEPAPIEPAPIEPAPTEPAPEK